MPIESLICLYLIEKTIKNQKICAYIDINPVKICTYILNTDKKFDMSPFNWKNDIKSKDMLIY